MAAALGCAVLSTSTIEAVEADLILHVDAREVAARRVHTELRLRVQAGALTLVFPKWIPGEHGPTGPLESTIGLIIRANGEPLPWQRDPLDLYAINVLVPNGVTTLAISIDTGLATEGGVFSTSPTNSEHVAVLPWNELVLLPKGRDAAELTTDASVLAPSGWHLGCALQLDQGAEGGVRIEHTTLATLIDSPLQMGLYAKRIELGGSDPQPDLRHALSVVADTEAALHVPEDFAAGYERLIRQAGILFGTRMYRHYTWLLTLSDHVGNFGLEHHESSDDRGAENSLSEAPLRERIADTLAHEYVHSWNGKYRRPVGLLSPDYQRPMDGSLLWVYEGLTQFWGSVLAVRAQLETLDSYREMLASMAGTLDVQSGSRWRPLADTAVAAQVLLGAPESWHLARRGVDFYNASVFLWLNVDAELRRKSSDRVSLDTFMNHFFAGAGGAPAVKPYVERDVYAALAALTSGDWRVLIRRHLDTTGPQAMKEGLLSAGWRLSYSATENSFIALREKQRRTTERLWSIGLTADRNGTILDTVEQGAAAEAGAAPGMKVLAVNGRKYRTEVLDAAIVEAQTTRRPIELLVDNADYYRTLSVRYFEGARYPHLSRVDGRPDTLSETLKTRAD